MKKRKVTYKQWRWPKYLLFMMTNYRQRRFLRRYFDIDIDLYGESLRAELDAQAEENLRRVSKRKEVKKITVGREYIEKKLQFLVDCGYTYQYNEIDGECSLVYKKGAERDGYYIAVYFDEQFESCMLRTPDASFAELAKSELTTPDWRTQYQNAAPLVRLDMAAELLQREATK